MSDQIEIEKMLQNVDQEKPQKVPVPSLIRKFVLFLKHPDQEPESLTKSQKFSNIFKLLCWSYFLVFIIGTGINALLRMINYTGTNRVGTVSISYDQLTIIILASIVIPLIEEIMFRLPLRFRPINLALATFFFVRSLYTIFSVSIVKNPIDNLIIGLIISFIWSGLVFYIFRYVIDQHKAQMFYKKRFKSLFYFSVILFGALHIFNYSDWKSLLFLAPIIVLPQIIIGFALGFIRIKYGFWYGFITHGVYNFFLILPFLQLIVALSTGDTSKAVAYVLPLCCFIVIGFITIISDLTRGLAEKRLSKDRS
jgi:hypothetical protein